MNTLANEIEALERMRTRWLLINLIGFIIWDGFRMLDSYVISGGISNTYQIILIIGWLIWVLGFIQLTRLGMKAKKTKMALQVLNDEMVAATRLKTWRLALIAVVFTQVGIIALSFDYIQISGVFAAELTIFVSVVSAIGSFIYFDRNPTDG
ncbi:MAG: hypothetical protein R8G66_29415 [Cytophagales bacterium]|nr:hypothetical protein [Cytophagales bacterium]